MQTEAGRVTRNGGGADPEYKYEYTLSDHLGNARVYFDIYSGAARQIQATDYYAFGLAIQNGTLIGAENKYQYNGKEKQDETKLYDYGARFYDQVIGRWTTPDPLAEKSRRWSPYTYGKNNPMIMIDPDGMFDININGAKADEATKQLASSTSLTINRDPATGKLSASGEAKTKNDERLLEAIRNPDVKVNITADGSKTIAGPNGSLLMAGGAFNGNTIGTESRITDYDFAAFQQNKLSAIPGVPLYQFDNEGDMNVDGIVGRLNGSKHAKQAGRQEKGSNDNVNPSGGHAITDFLNAISTLSEGTYKFINGEFIKQ